MLQPVVDFEECIGCGACVELCPDVFELRDEKSWVIHPKGATAAIVRRRRTYARSRR